ncbi:cholecystokinin receptor-like [Mytilus edulis]|uniref:cholecystokinin receptor-like n=1 Tax=Mytilus edulis TaxID=6550 RepID=UPI0039EFA394
MEDTFYWNAYLTRLFIPLHILLILFIIIGVAGNGLVIYIYGFKMKTIKDGQYFIPYLAVADLLGSVICSLFGLSMTLMPVTYEFDVLCKCGWLLGSATTCMSVFLLVTIAIQRYLKVCRRKGYILTLKWKKVVMICSLFLSVVITGPSVVTYGSIPFHSINRNVTGMICGKITGTVSIVYDAVLCVSVILCCGLLIVPYCLIGRKTYRYMKKGNQSEVELKKFSKNKTFEQQTEEQSISTLDSELKIEYSKNYSSNEHLSDKILTDQGKQSLRNNIKIIKKPPKNLTKTNRRVISKITKIFMIIILIFLICSLPKISITILETVTADFWETASDIERLVLMFVHQGYILNNIANPFIYAFFDETFKTEIKNMFYQSVCANKRYIFKVYN